ncbi:hypothetical protein [Serratia sp. 2723]|uniref:hypothetical protein n=1 Tax=unclassified Serratia (in: enterobacteria) TaxID=2647522 RepID=UPI003D1B5ABF
MKCTKRKKTVAIAMVTVLLSAMATMGTSYATGFGNQKAATSKFSISQDQDITISLLPELNLPAGQLLPVKAKLATVFVKSGTNVSKNLGFKWGDANKDASDGSKASLKNSTSSTPLEVQLASDALGTAAAELVAGSGVYGDKSATDTTAATLYVVVSTAMTPVPGTYVATLTGSAFY